MHQERARRRSGAKPFVLYSSDEDERHNYISENNCNSRPRRNSTFRQGTPASGSEYRRKSLVGNKSSNNFLNRQASVGKRRATAEEFDALCIPKTIITIASGLAAGVFIAVLVVSLLQAGDGVARLHGDYLLCSKHATSRTCIPDNDSNAVLNVVIALQKNLSIEAGLAECYPLKKNQANISIDSVKQFVSTQTKISDRLLMKYVTWIIIANPLWNLRVQNTSGGDVSTLQYVVDKSLRIKSIQPVKTLSCVARLWAHYLWCSIWHIVLGVVILIVGYYSYLWYADKKHQQQLAVFIMVDKIIEVLMSHYKSSLNKKDLLPYVAISHVRDMLIPPSERVRRDHIWHKAVDWIAKSDTRVRVESRMIAGEQFTVWRWIQSDPPATDCPDKDEKWQGKAFDAVSPPSCPPSLCMRLKNMFDSTIHVSPGDITAIQDALLHKCMNYGRVVHIIVDKRSLFGCVYMKLDTMSSALAVYKALHGSWFNGRLITAKYIAPERYHKWFPAAENAIRSVYPSDT